jgi:coenzyme F420-0:L-glutamate ligase/coenzyme F420-1:gamma-L-glutamate ligase
VLRKLEVIGIGGFPEVQKGDDIAGLLHSALRDSGLELQDGDVVVIKQKIVSKAEGRLVKLDSVRPSAKALKLAGEQGKDPALVELVLGEAVRVVRAGHGVIITETKSGLVCANSGIDMSNVKPGYAALLPSDPDASSRKIRRALTRLLGKNVAVIITDTFGRPWRRGQTDIAIGCSGIEPLYSYRGKQDKFGYELRVTEPAVVDEIAGAAELVIGKLNGIPAALIRGVQYNSGEAGIRSIRLEAEKDLFR